MTTAQLQCGPIFSQTGITASSISTQIPTRAVTSIGTLYERRAFVRGLLVGLLDRPLLFPSVAPASRRFLLVPGGSGAELDEARLPRRGLYAPPGLRKSTRISTSAAI